MTAEVRNGVMAAEHASAPRRPLRPGVSIIDVEATARAAGFDLRRLPRSHRILLENVLVHERKASDYASAFKDWLDGIAHEVPFRPARILSHDTAGIAMLVDLAALRDKIAAAGGDPSRVDSAVPIDLVIDHSVAADIVGTPDAMAENMRREFVRNKERYQFLKWAEGALANLRIIPPGSGICHQVNMEFLATGIVGGSTGKELLLADTVIGTDSHTTMINALGVLGWGVGGIEAEVVAMGEALVLGLPPVTGCRLVGRRAPMISAADIVLFIVQALRRHGVVGKIVEFHGDGLDQLSMGDRAAIANMAPEYGATCGMFPIDPETIRFYRETGRAEQQVNDILAHAKALGTWRDDGLVPSFSDELVIDLSEIVPVLAGPKRPQQTVPLPEAPQSFRAAFPLASASDDDQKTGNIQDGDVLIAAITSCTHTSNPHQMLAAGLLARNARAAGLKPKAWVKTSLSPGSRAVGQYLQDSGLQDSLDNLGFNTIGYGCMTCAGNSGDLAADLSAQVRGRALSVCAVLSANRNFEGRTHPDISACYLAAPALVIAYALAGSILVDLTTDPLGFNSVGQPIRLADIWPSDDEINEYVRRFVTAGTYQRAYDPVELVQSGWQQLAPLSGDQFSWDPDSTFVQRPPFFTSGGAGLSDLAGARPLAVLGDNITTDHISPFGRILSDSAAARYLEQHGVEPEEWSSYAERRGNHEVLWRGTFSNPKLRNDLANGKAGGYTSGPDGSVINIVEAADAYRAAGVPTVVFAGREYGTGSARDWAAKGTLLMGVKAVVAESFERIHRGNLVGVGVVPCQLPEGVTVASLGVKADTSIAIEGLAGLNGPLGTVRLVLTQGDGSTSTVPLTCRIDTQAELAQIREGGLFATSEASAKERATRSPSTQAI